MVALQSTIGKILKDRAFQSPDQEAIVSKKMRLTYQEYDQLTNQFAKYLLAQGVKKGDRVALVMGVSEAFPLSLMAVAKIGAIFVPINYTWKRELIYWALEQIAPKLILFEDQYEGLISQYTKKSGTMNRQIVENGSIQDSVLEELQSFSADDLSLEIDPNDPFTIVYTAGTTGLPKGVVASQNTYFATGIVFQTLVEGESNNRFLLANAMYQIFSVLLCSIHSLVGITLILLHKLDPDDFIDTIHNEKVNITLLPPYLLGVYLPMLQKRPSQLSTLRRIISSGCKVPCQIIEVLKKLDIEVIDVIGFTETTGILTIKKSHMDDCNPDSLGKPYLFPEIKVLDPETKEEVSTGEVGELALRGPTIFQEYWNSSKKTEKAFYNGWFLTGDMVRINKKGSIELVERYKNVIYLSRLGGILPANVEKVIREIPEVKDVAVIGIYNEKYGEIPCGFVQVEKGSLLIKQDILDYVHTKMEKFNLVDAVVNSEPLPRKENGKIDTEQLRNRYQEYVFSSR